LYCNKLGLC